MMRSIIGARFADARFFSSATVASVCFGFANTACRQPSQQRKTGCPSMTTFTGGPIVPSRLLVLGQNCWASASLRSSGESSASDGCDFGLRVLRSRGTHHACRGSLSGRTAIAAEIDRADRRIQPRFRVDQKRTARYHALARLQPAEHRIKDCPVFGSHSRPDFHLHAFEYAGRRFAVHDLLASSVDDRPFGNG